MGGEPSAERARGVDRSTPTETVMMLVALAPVVGAILAAWMMEDARLLAARTLDDAKRPRHAEMHQKHIARRQIGEEILRPAAKPGDNLPVEARQKILLQRKAQVAATRFHTRNLGPFHHRLQSAPDGLDFGIYPHQVMTAPSNRTVILVDRGNDAAHGKPEEPGAL